MAAGEYVSVSSQSDTEGADLARERRELFADPEAERRFGADRRSERSGIRIAANRVWRRKTPVGRRRVARVA
jgi:hypothetical protein